MANNSTKPKRRMKKQVRRTIGGVLLASAIAVAAIPTSSYDGGEALASTSINGNGDTIYTHVVTSAYADSEGNHSEDYTLAPSGVASTFSHVYVTYKDPATASKVYNSNIPICDPSTTTIYCTGDGDFKFAYVPSTGNQNDGGDKYAVILGYSHTGALTGGNLTIPDKVAAYLNYNDNAGSGSGFAAVGKSGNFLYYITDTVTSTYTVKTETQQVQKKDVNGKYLWKIQKNGVDITGEYDDDQVEGALATERANDPTATFTKVPSTESVTGQVTTYYAPCYYSQKDVWSPGGNDVDLYYFPTNNWRQDGTAQAGAAKDESSTPRVMPVLANTQTFERIADATVAYIGNQYLKATASGWQIDTSANTYGLINDTNGADKGIFANNGNIQNLTIGGDVQGIGDYAFYGCTAITSVSLGNGIQTLGNHAFDGCRNMATLNIPDNCNVTVMGAYAFKECQALTTFTLPVNVTKLGDGIFKGCKKLKTINLLSTGNGSLNEVGQHVFMSCQALESITFPDDWTQVLELSEFEGCKALKYISCNSSDFKIVPSTSCDFNWDAFSNEFGGGESGDILTREKFYIESANNSPIHTICSENEISFKYLNQEVYEKTKKESGLTAADNVSVTYQIDNTNTLTNTTFNGVVTSLTFPSYIGPYYIKNIGAESFMDRCTLTKVTISETIESIGDRAFMGCHNLKYVVFQTDSVNIGTDAFKTQNVTTHDKTNCPTGGESDYASKYQTAGVYSKSDMTDSATNKPKVELTFVGNIDADSTPYKYAMSVSGSYNNGSQAPSFVHYTSGWPTFLTVEFQYDDTTGTGYSELIDFPTIYSLNEYANKPYLTDAQKSAANSVITNMASPTANLTEDQITFRNAASSLTIPSGIDAIEDGLFYHLTQDGAAAGTVNPMAVYIYGLNKIESGLTSETTETPAYADAVVDPIKSDFAGCEKISALYIFGDVGTIEEHSFAGCENMESVTINGKVTKIGDHTFEDCAKLENVTITNELTDFGIRPFGGCELLETVDFQNSTKYITENSIIYEKDASGNKYKILEVLEGRSNKRVPAAEISGVTALAKEAFAGSNVTSIYLTNSAVSNIPERAFMNCESLRTVELPGNSMVQSVMIQNDAFLGSSVDEIVGQQNVTLIAARGTDGIHTSAYNAGAGTGLTSNSSTTYNKNVTIYAPEDSYLYNYAKMYDFLIETVAPTYSYTVVFYDWSEEQGVSVKVSNEIIVAEGEAVSDSDIPTPVGRDGYSFDSWVSNNTDSTLKAIYADTIFTAKYNLIATNYFTVTIYDYDGNVYKTYQVAEGATLEESNISLPQYENATDADGVVYYHNGWNPDGNIYVTSPITRDAFFRPIFSQSVATSYLITYKDGDGKTVGTEYVVEGEYPKGISYSYNDGTKSFTGWNPDLTNIKIFQDYTCNAQYQTAEGYFTVLFQYIDPVTYMLVTYNTLSVSSGTDVSKMAANPSIEGYTFNGWGAANLTPNTASLANVTCDITAVGTFSKSVPDVDPTPDDPTPKPGTGTTPIGGFDIPDDYDPETNGLCLYYDIVGNPYAYRIISKGAYAPNIAKPVAYSDGYEWSPAPEATAVETVAYFNLIPSTGSSNGKFTAYYYYPDGVTLYQALTDIDSGSCAPNLAMPSGYTNYVWSPDPAATEITRNTRFTMVNPTGAGGGVTPGAYYTLTVVGGSGSGSYLAGSQVIIVANDPASGQKFGSWTISTDTKDIASTALAATVITMPSSNVTVTANFVASGSGGGTPSGDGSGGSGGTGGTGGGTTPSAVPVSGGTTVVIDKNGLSNTGVVAATVNGSSDNFTIKISESSTASEAVLKALVAQYGDISNIVYFPMDISLYDASGDHLITDTSGLTVTITLPIPDSMIQYGGNNKAACIINNQLDVLAPTFTTINGVDCITFTCTHFSPYVIYVDTQNLTASGTIDKTPKTGDFLKPKYFLAIGMAAVAVFLFVKKDKKPVKAKATT